LPEECGRLRACEAILRDLFVEAGAGEIATPAFEYAEVLERGFGNPDLFFRLPDFDGRVLALRPELTTPAARLFATAMADRPLPLKIFYIGQVFRQAPKHRGLFREFRQAGFECYGGERRGEDLATIRLAAQALERLALPAVVLEIGHVGIVESILDEAGLDGRQRDRIRIEVGRKDRGALRRLGAPEILERLVRLPARPEALAEARTILAESKARAALDELEAVVAALGDLPLSTVIEIAAVREIDYYTGIVFEALHSGLGRSILGGGRYDRLVEEFGAATPATGFSLELEAILRNNN
jgi:ATP phosphoribosyltransferase regulatory subunit